MLLYPSFEPFYIQLLLLCVKLYTRILQSWKKNAALIHQTYLCLIFCGLIYFSNFSRPGSSPSNSSSRHRIGKCKLIFDTGYTSMGREIDFKILQYELYKRREKFDLFAMKSKKEKKTNSFVRFLGESMARQSAFEINWPSINGFFFVNSPLCLFKRI